jgi:hypothetical protein
MVLVAFRIESAGNVSVCHRELEFEFLTLISDVQIEAKSERSSDGHRRQCIKYVSHPDCVLLCSCRRRGSSDVLNNIEGPSDSPAWLFRCCRHPRHVSR